MSDRALAKSSSLLGSAASIARASYPYWVRLASLCAQAITLFLLGGHPDPAQVAPYFQMVATASLAVLLIDFGVFRTLHRYVFRGKDATGMLWSVAPALVHRVMLWVSVYGAMVAVSAWEIVPATYCFAGALLLHLASFVRTPLIAAKRTTLFVALEASHSLCFVAVLLAAYLVGDVLELQELSLAYLGAAALAFSVAVGAPAILRRENGRSASRFSNAVPKLRRRQTLLARARATGIEYLLHAMLFNVMTVSTIFGADERVAVKVSILQRLLGVSLVIFQIPVMSRMATYYREKGTAGLGPVYIKGLSITLIATVLGWLMQLLLRGGIHSGPLASAVSAQIVDTSMMAVGLVGGSLGLIYIYSHQAVYLLAKGVGWARAGCLLMAIVSYALMLPISLQFAGAEEAYLGSLGLALFVVVLTYGYLCSRKRTPVVHFLGASEL